MAPRFDAITAGLNRSVMATFGGTVVLIDTSGGRHSVAGDCRQDPVLVDPDHRGAISTFQAVLGIDLHTWPSGVSLPTTDWTVEIPADFSASAERLAGCWEIADTQPPGGGWLDLYLCNRMPL